MNERICHRYSRFVVAYFTIQSERLSQKAASIFNQADDNEARIYIPNIVLVEIVYLMEKTRIPKKSLEKLINLLYINPNTSNYPNKRLNDSCEAITSASIKS